MHLKPEDANVILKKIISHSHTKGHSRSQDDDYHNELGFPNDYVENIFRYIKKHKPKFIILESDATFAKIVPAREEEILRFLELGGFAMRSNLSSNEYRVLKLYEQNKVISWKHLRDVFGHNELMDITPDELGLINKKLSDFQFLEDLKIVGNLSYSITSKGIDKIFVHEHQRDEHQPAIQSGDYKTYQNSIIASGSTVITNSNIENSTTAVDIKNAHPPTSSHKEKTFLQKVKVVLTDIKVIIGTFVAILAFAGFKIYKGHIIPAENKDSAISNTIPTTTSVNPVNDTSQNKDDIVQKNRNAISNHENVKTIKTLDGWIDANNTPAHYHGEVINDIPNGFGEAYGTFTYNGEKKKYHYVGNWVDGKAEGKGTFTDLSTGTIFANCTWRNNFAVDTGTVTIPDLYIYHGELRFSSFNGKGTMEWLNGDMPNFPPGSRKYTGEWINNQISGYGILYNANGMIIYQGNFKNGKAIDLN